jgi:hypothetical protein
MNSLLPALRNPWKFVAVGASGGGANPAVPLPAGIQQGDLLILSCASLTNTFGTVPAGWTALVQNQNYASSYYFSIYAKIASASESAPTVTVSGGDKCYMLAWRNISASYLDVQGTVSTATSTTIATNSLTTTKHGDLIVSFFYEQGGSVGQTWTAPANTTERLNVPGDTLVGPGMEIVDELQNQYGATTQRTATINATKGLASIAIAFAEI